MSDQPHVHDENCEHEEEQEIVVLTDDEGVDHEFLVVDVMEVENRNYAILVPNEDDEGEGVILRIESDEDGEEYLVDIEDDQEWQKVVAAYESLAGTEE
ncbi:MAG: hypothetical protein JWN30_1398 [Bacilli bacterium]|nr:hypothetical protein [Bacilli bacterium]